MSDPMLRQSMWAVPGVRFVRICGRDPQEARTWHLF
jgi:hypothetical protein